MYYDIFYEIKQYVSLYPEKLEGLTLADLDLKERYQGGKQNGSVNDSGIVCSDYWSVLF